VLIENFRLRQSVRELLSNTVGTDAVKYINGLVELRSELALCEHVRVVIVDIPMGITPRGHLETIAKLTQAGVKIVMIYSIQNSVSFVQDNPDCTLVSDSHINIHLKKAIGAH